MALEVPWNNVREWLTAIGLGQYADTFDYHEITGEELPFLKEYQLKEMGVDSIGDRLKIIGETKNFLRALRNEKRQKVILKFKNWYPLSLCGIFERWYEISEASIVVKDPQPCRCRQVLDSIDVTSITDIRMEVGLLFTYVTIKTKDPSMQAKGGKVTMRVRHERGTRVHGTLKNLWEEDQLRLGRKGAIREEVF